MNSWIAAVLNSLWQAIAIAALVWAVLKVAPRVNAATRHAVWWLVLVCYAGLTAASLTAQTHILENLLMHSWIAVFAVLTLAGFIGMRLCLTIGFDLGAFAGAACVIAGLLGGVAAGQFPYLMPAAATTAHVLTIYNAGAGQFGSGISVFWWIIPAFGLATVYNIVKFRGNRQNRAIAMAAPQCQSVMTGQ